MKLKRTLFRIFFVIEIGIFAFVYFFGAHGMHTMLQLKQENESLQKMIATLSGEVNQLEIQIDDLESYPFYKEKIAREKLQMARKGDIIYYL